LQQVYLAHLSKDCNNARLVHEKFAPLLKKLSIKVVDPQSGIAPASKAI